jgi:uncharacterized protein YndB with AHSA1/START domain
MPDIVWIILAAIAALVVLLLIVVAMQPANFRVVRSGSVAAPAADVFPQVNDFHNWDAWSPWAKLDPTMKQTYEGTPAGAGAKYSWSGKGNVGEGSMTLLESHPNEVIRIRLEFQKPFKATNATEFTFKPEGNQTVVTWSMAGHKNFIFKAVGLFMNMDKMLGAQFEQGLANMKAVVEAKKRVGV